MKKQNISLCESCIHAYYCRILIPSRCENNFCLAVNSNFNSDLKISYSEQTYEVSVISIDD